MNRNPSCPDPDLWRRFMLGHLPTPEANLLEDHLSTCDPCKAHVDRLPAEDALVVAMRGRSRILSDSSSTQVEGLIERGRNVWRADHSALN
jgi:hypothetical protein